MMRLQHPPLRDGGAFPFDGLKFISDMYHQLTLSACLDNDVQFSVHLFWTPSPEHDMTTVTIYNMSVDYNSYLTWQKNCFLLYTTPRRLPIHIT